jgi:hypothetical protein
VTCGQDANGCFYVASTTSCSTSCSGGECLPEPDAGADAGSGSGGGADGGDGGSGGGCSGDLPQQCGDAGACDLITHDCCALAVLQSVSGGGYTLISEDAVCQPKAPDGGTTCPTTYSGSSFLSGAASIGCAQSCDCNGAGICCANDDSSQNGGYSGAALCAAAVGGACPGADAGAVQLCVASSECANGAECITQSCTKSLGFGINITETVSSCGLGSGCTAETSH